MPTSVFLRVSFRTRNRIRTRNFPMPLTSVNSIHFCSKSISSNYRTMTKRRQPKSVIVSANGATITSMRGDDYNLEGINTGYNSFFKQQRMSFGRFATYDDCSEDDSDHDVDDVSVASSKGASTLDNVDEWKWKFSMLLRNDGEQELTSSERKDRRDYEQLIALAERMGLYSRQYAKVVVFSKVPLPNYRADLDDKRPQREVSIPTGLQREVDALLEDYLSRKHTDRESFPYAPFSRLTNNDNFATKEGQLDHLDAQTPPSTVMKQIQRRKSLQLHNQQELWQLITSRQENFTRNNHVSPGEVKVIR